MVRLCPVTELFVRQQVYGCVRHVHMVHSRFERNIVVEREDRNVVSCIGEGPIRLAKRLCVRSGLNRYAKAGYTVVETFLRTNS